MTLYIYKVAEVDQLQDLRIHMKQMVLTGTSRGHSLMAGEKLAPAYSSASVLLDQRPKCESMSTLSCGRSFGTEQGGGASRCAPKSGM